MGQRLQYYGVYNKMHTLTTANQIHFCAIFGYTSVWVCVLFSH